MVNTILCGYLRESSIYLVKLMGHLSVIQCDVAGTNPRFKSFGKGGLGLIQKNTSKHQKC